MNNNISIELLKTLADETRLKIVNILASGDSYIELIASKLGITEATVCYHLKKMEKAGLISSSRSQFYVIYSLNRDVFDRSLREIVISSEYAVDDDDKYRREVIGNFFRYGKLLSLPVQRKKREIVLCEISKNFEAGREYNETEVNEIITRFYDDYCTLRREMIAFGIMTRENDIYRKI